MPSKQREVKMKSIQSIVSVIITMLVAAMSGCSPNGIGDSPPNGLHYKDVYCEIVNNTSWDVTKISGPLGHWESSFLPLIPAGSAKYVSSYGQTYIAAGGWFVPLNVYANGRWSKMRIVDSSGNIHNDWDVRGPVPNVSVLFSNGMTLYLVDGGNGDLYLTNIPMK